MVVPRGRHCKRLVVMFGVASLFSSLAGEPPEQDAKRDAATQDVQTPPNQGSPEGASTSAAAGVSSALGALNIWGIASAVKAQADELVKSVAHTDWKAEIMAFSKEAAEEGSKISHKAREVVEHIPGVVEHMLPAEHDAGEQSGTEHTTAPRSRPDSFLSPDVSTTIKSFGTSLFKGTKDLIEQVRDAVESEIAIAAKEAKQKARAGNSSRGLTGSSSGAQLSALSGGGAKYSRFESEVAAMQRDSSTYCDEPADRDDYDKWKASFSVQGAQAQVDAILAENSFMAELYARIVPVIVEHQDFWTRYFYRLQKLQAKEEARQALAQRAKAVHKEEEEIAWEDLDTPTAASQSVSQTAPAQVATETSRTHVAEAGMPELGSVAAVEGERNEASAAHSIKDQVDAGTAAPPVTAAASSVHSASEDLQSGAASVPEAAQQGELPVQLQEQAQEAAQQQQGQEEVAQQQAEEHPAGPLEEASENMASATSSPTGRFSQDAHETGSEANSQGTSWVAVDATSSRGTNSGHASDAGAPSAAGVQHTAAAHAPAVDEAGVGAHQQGREEVESRGHVSSSQGVSPVKTHDSTSTASKVTGQQGSSVVQPAATAAAALIAEAAAAGHAAQQGVATAASDEDLLDDDLDLDSPPALPAGVRPVQGKGEAGSEEEDEAWGDWD